MAEADFTDIRSTVNVAGEISLGNLKGHLCERIDQYKDGRETRHHFIAISESQYRDLLPLARKEGG